MWRVKRYFVGTRRGQASSQRRRRQRRRSHLASPTTHKLSPSHHLVHEAAFVSLETRSLRAYDTHWSAAEMRGRRMRWESIACPPRLEKNSSALHIHTVSPNSKVSSGDGVSDK